MKTLKYFRQYNNKGNIMCDSHKTTIKILRIMTVDMFDNLYIHTNSGTNNWLQEPAEQIIYTMVKKKLMRSFTISFHLLFNLLITIG